ncbi:MAG: hypothetical protein D6805_04840 [Planctomycetota bacterium]|nr:MAG: hypothetical protein D6805_04840 [Planctomycetota bacterium]
MREIEQSGLGLRPEYREYDAREKFGLALRFSPGGHWKIGRLWYREWPSDVWCHGYVSMLGGSAS